MGALNLPEKSTLQLSAENLIKFSEEAKEIQKRIDFARHELETSNGNYNKAKGALQERVGPNIPRKVYLVDHNGSTYAVIVELNKEVSIQKTEVD